MDNAADGPACPCHDRERRLRAAAIIWATLWNELGLGCVTPADFVYVDGGPKGAAYLKAADRVIADLDAGSA